MRADREPLVWLPFDPARLGASIPGLRYDVVPDPAQHLPDSIGEVAFYVPPYRFNAADNTILPRMSSLQVLQTMTAGVEHIRPHLPEGVTLCNGRGIHDTSTAELALTLVLASLRGVPQFVRQQDAARWDPETRPALADKRVLIVGYGSVGAAIERRLAPFEVDVVRVARRAREGVHPITELPALLPDADVVVLVVPLTEATRGHVDDGFLAAMKAGALLVNVARGAVVDTDALLRALESGSISAALDVTDPEPLPENHPLWRAPNLLLVPHVGGASSAMWPRAHRLVRAQLERFAAGEPLENVMDGDY
ncbi:2-hydroxyacid dehydrogenase [Nocardioides sp.]|uniref:2-hydroxyacid dehydrogenase n=1 Tax=Nocardioides sp. TaxID=35761 RepID=UPI002733378B|nr:2-hydroxyacid dehydrogenase [Nocardioides sp.]MDP3892023.1 2-hydroxyacid dehydrogenase [Nocardioides sp.]